MFIFDSEDDMNNKEAELVTKEFVKEDTNYNLCPGGNGGFGYINENIMTPEFRSHLGNIGGICKKTHITGYREMLNDPKRAAKRNKSISNTRKKRFMSGDIINGFTIKITVHIPKIKCQKSIKRININREIKILNLVKDGFIL